jgi:hypothetical protein
LFSSKTLLLRRLRFLTLRTQYKPSAQVLTLRIPYKTATQAREIIDGFGLLASKIDSKLNSLADARGSDSSEARALSVNAGIPHNGPLGTDQVLVLVLVLEGKIPIEDEHHFIEREHELRRGDFCGKCEGGMGTHHRAQQAEICGVPACLSSGGRFLEKGCYVL